MTRSPLVEQPAEGRLTSVRGVEYLGSHPGAPASVPGVDVVVANAGVRFERRGQILGGRPWSVVVGLDADGTLTSRRANLPLAYVLGLLAWRFPHRSDTAPVLVDTTGASSVFGVDDLSIDELRDGFAQLAPYHREQGAS